MESCRSVTIPASVKRCRETGRIDCFRLNWKPGMPNQPHRFFDSDFAKVLEGMAYMLELHPEDKALAEELDRFVDLVISAQQPDGYLNTYYTCVEPENRWKNLFESHELYCAGHLIEAAVAHFRATGSPQIRRRPRPLCRLYQHRYSAPVRIRNRGIPGTRSWSSPSASSPTSPARKNMLNSPDSSSTNAARRRNYFVEEAIRNGSQLSQEQLANRQADRPVREELNATGHSVRALYLYSGHG